MVHARSARRRVLVTVMAVALLLTTRWAGSAGRLDGEVAVRPPRRVHGRVIPVPRQYRDLYHELETRLNAFSERLDALGSGQVGEPAWGGTLSTFNGNRGPAILSADTWEQTREMLSAFERMGVTVVKIDVTYPLLTSAFHQWIHARVPSYTLSAQDYLDRYRDVVQAIHAHGMSVLIEHSSLFRGGFAALDPSGYYASIAALGPVAARQRYGAERAAEALAISSEVKPDRLTLLDEPDTQNANFGPVGGHVLLTPAQWVSLVQTEAQLIQGSGLDNPPLLGAGSGSWDVETYVQSFAAMPELDSVDIHIYPIATQGGSLLDRVLQWSEDIHAIAPGKRITIGEAWLYKASAAEVSAGMDAEQVYGRDVYAFWSPLDQLFLRLLARLARLEGYAAVCPFWTAYDFASLRWGDPALRGLTPLQLLGRANDAAMVNMGRGILAPTGRAWLLIAHGRDGLP
ncbi:MAG: hypothetical protein GXP48_11460 [Acidobacteria bacterium]|nr:hypothetical protein [Acidobacteriota bacterium]